MAAAKGLFEALRNSMTAGRAGIRSEARTRMTHRKELDYMNAAACLLVILIHVLSLGITQADPAAWQSALIYIPWRLAAFVVPMFLYTGAVKVAWQFGDGRISPEIYLRYILRRFRKTYVPYVVWVVIYYLYFLCIHYVKGNVREFVSYLLIGNLSAPFYYIVIVMQFYVLMPLWVWMLRHVRVYTAVIASLLITLLMGRFGALLGHFGIEFLYTDRIFPTYLAFWVAGLYTGKHYSAFAPTTRERSTRAICILGVAMHCAISYWQYAAGAYIFNLDVTKLFSDLLSIILVHSIASEAEAWFGGLPGRLLGKVYQASFFVYLSHCLFLDIATKLLRRAGIERLSILLPARLAVCYTAPFLLYFALRWLRNCRETRKNSVYRS